MPRRIQGDHREFHKVIGGKTRRELKRLTRNASIVGMRPKGGKFVFSVPRIDSPHIVCGDNGEGVGRGPVKKGDVIGREPQQGKDGEGGDEHQDGIKVAIDQEDVFRDLGNELSLPAMLPKPTETYEDVKLVYTDISKIGPRSLRHPRRTLIEAIKRMSMTGELENLHMLPGNTVPMRMITPINSDQRYRQYREIKIPTSNAVIFFARDCSGSVDDFRCDIINDIAWWLDAWIQRFYERVERCYLVHDTESMEVDQETFYRYRQAGGTICSTAFKQISELMENRFPPQTYNIYVFYFTDGENQSSDNAKLMDLIQKQLPASDVNLIGVTQVVSRDSSNNVLEYLKKNKEGLSEDFLRLHDLVCDHDKESRDTAVLEAIRYLLGRPNVKK